MNLILLYTLIAGVLAALTAPIPGTSLLMTGLEIYMLAHLAKIHEFKFDLKKIGYPAAVIYGAATLLQDLALEILTFVPVVGWAAEVVIAVLFVFFLGMLANLYFSKRAA